MKNKDWLTLSSENTIIYKDANASITNAVDYPLPTKIIINLANHSAQSMPWQCFFIKNKDEIVYIPSKIENVPNAFQRFMLKYLLGIIWSKR